MAIEVREIAIISNNISTPAALKKIKWFTKSDHELFRDCEREAVIDSVVSYVMSRVDANQQSRNIK